jgi:hypothetical protein
MFKELNENELLFVNAEDDGELKSMGGIRAYKWLISGLALADRFNRS